jgi:hypothetical protein
MVSRIGNPSHCARYHRPRVHASSNARQHTRPWLADVFQRHHGSGPRIPRARMDWWASSCCGWRIRYSDRLLVITQPVAGALAWTLLFASFLIVIGLFRLTAAIWLRYRSWEWAVFDGIVTLALGLLLWSGLLWSGLCFLGFALGIAFLLRVWSAVMFAFAVKRISNPVLIRRVA